MRAVCADRVSGIAVPPSGDACISCSTDRSARLYKIPTAPLEAGMLEKEVPAVLEFQGKFGFRGIDHRWQGETFATVGEKARLLTTPAANGNSSFQGSILPDLKGAEVIARPALL